MCQALEELMADEMEAMKKSGWREGEKYGRQKGMDRFARLSILLLKENHQEQLLKASEDEAYREELFKSIIFDKKEDLQGSSVLF